MRINNGGPAASLDSIVLFAFDDRSIPFQHGVKLNLAGRQAGHGNKPVVPLGETGTHDSMWIAYYGTVLAINGELWMWYLGQGPDEHWHQRVCLARSKDGRIWNKPDLGLVEWHGSRHNNLVDMGEDMHVQACVVFHEPDEPDPDKRFKMAFQPRKHSGRVCAAYSADGLTWRESPHNPVGGRVEMAGGTKVDGCYFLAGQGGKHAVGVRQLVTCASCDFEHWTDATCSGLRRSNVSPQPLVAGKNTGEQVHLGAALWNRGNVIIGFFGKWNGHPSNDRRMVTMDLGLAVSNDALHYSEPIPDFPIVSAAEDGWGLKRRESLALNFPALTQGQGFENVGDETLFWYAPWPEEASDGVRVTSWPRDRLGYFSPYEGGIWAYASTSDPHFVSAPIQLEGGAARLAVNVEGINEHSSITVEIQDHAFRPLPGYDRGASRGPVGPGLAQPIGWHGHDVIDEVTGPIRVRVDFGGVRPEDVRLYAVYLDPA